MNGAPVHLIVCLHYPVASGMEAEIWFSGCMVLPPPPELVFAPLFLEIFVEVKVSILSNVVGGKQGHASCRILLLQQSPSVSVQFSEDH